MHDGRKLITISVPVYNEEANVRPLIAALQAFAASEPNYDFEFLFTDNASEDKTFELLSEMAQQEKRIRVLRFSRNFGFQRSILTNFREARGDAAVQIDADLQDPPSVISEFLRYWEKGFKVVYGVRRHRVESKLMRGWRKLGYRVISRLSDVAVPLDAGDFRLIDRIIIDHLATIIDRTPYLRGLIAGLGYPQVGIPYDRKERTAGESKFGFWSILRLGFDGICSQSTKLLQFITVAAVCVMFATLALAFIYLLVGLFSDQQLPAGFMTLALINLTSLGINALFLGIIGEYLGRTYNNVRGLPLAIIEKTAGGEPRPAERLPS